jgi:hypothetical protein
MVISSKKNTPESKSLIRLTDISSFPKEYQESIKAIIKYTKEKNRMPDDYHARIDSKSDDKQIIFHLWHKDRLKLKNKVFSGDPTHKCRDVYYDLDKKQVIKETPWR